MRSSSTRGILGILGFVFLGLMGAQAASTITTLTPEMITMPGKSYSGPWVPLDEHQMEIREHLRSDLDVLCNQIGERHIWRHDRLQQAANWIEDSFQGMGYSVRRQPFVCNGVTCYNLEVTVPGTQPDEGILVVGAHYDTVKGSVGANDNGTGVVTLLQLARHFAGKKNLRPLRFVAFANEEAPANTLSPGMGSLVNAKACRARGEKVAMISLETMGYYSNEEGSQNYPAPLDLYYPTTGNFVGFIGNTKSLDFIRPLISVFRTFAQVPSEGGGLADSAPGVGWSDHASFWSQGYPGLMITDTAPFRYPHYHTAEDTTDKVMYTRLARVVDALGKTLDMMANGEMPSALRDLMQ